MILTKECMMHTQVQRDTSDVIVNYYCIAGNIEGSSFEDIKVFYLTSKKLSLNFCQSQN